MKTRGEKTGGRWAGGLAIAALAALLVLMLDHAAVLAPWEFKAYDGFFYLRARVAPPPEAPEPPIVIVGIDDQTFSNSEYIVPQTLWHEYFADVILGLAQGGAKAVCLDFLLPRGLFDDKVPNYSRTWLRTLGMARHLGTPVITGIIEFPNRQLRPADRFLQIIGKEHIGIFNLTTDQDDFIRRQNLFFPLVEDPSQGLYHVAFLMARAGNPDLQAPQEPVYIDYDPRPRPFPHYSFAEVRQKASEKNWDYFQQHFKNSLVFIGETDTYTSDRHATPLYHLASGALRRTPGVEIQAQTTSTLLRQSFFKDLGPGARGSVYLCLSLLVCLSVLFGPVRWSPAWVPVWMLVWLTISAGAFFHDLILPAVGGLLALLVAGISSFSFRYLVVDREKRKILDIFGRYLPRKVALKVLATKEKDFFRGEERRLCLLFSDIRGFTTYSENRPPAEVVSRLNEYFAAMSRVVSREGGVVDKFLGDGLMAFFGAFDEDSPSLAGARAAMGMLQELDRLNGSWSEDGQLPFRIGIGLHTGLVKVGNIGSPDKMEYTVIGDAVNLASRLQDKTKTFGEAIIMSEDVRQDLSENAEVADLGFTDIKGRSQTHVYALKRLRERS